MTVIDFVIRYVIKELSVELGDLRKAFGREADDSSIGGSFMCCLGVLDRARPLPACIVDHINLQNIDAKICLLIPRSISSRNSETQ